MAKITKEQAKKLVEKLKHRKKTEGKPNIEGVSAPKKHKPKKSKEHAGHKPAQPGSVGIGAKGGRYIQEPSGHKRYIKEGNLSGSKKIKKSLDEFFRKEVIEPFIKSFKKGK